MSPPPSLPPLQIKIERHALPRRALGRADIARRSVKNVLPGLPLLAMGHAIVCNGVNTTTGLVRLKNSWGTSWGREGHAYLSFADLERLIAEDGEVVLPRELTTAKVLV